MASLSMVLYHAKIISKLIMEYLGTRTHYIHKYDNFSHRVSFIHSLAESL